MSTVPDLACRLDMMLGEGPVWVPSEQALWFVDIKAGRIHRFSPEAGICQSFEVGGNPSFIFPIASGGFLVGSGNALHRFKGGVLSTPVLTLDTPQHTRTNDASVDNEGRLWFGTMDDQERQPIGALHCLADGQITKTTWSAVVTNGPALSSDGTYLYHVDSGERTIWRIRLDQGRCPAEGEIFASLGDHEGSPDGVVLDSEDCLWVALWDGWAVRRYAPDATLLEHIDMPCARPTKVAFGGPDLRTAYVTTARVGLTRAELEQQPLAGSLLGFRVPVPGLVLPSVHFHPPNQGQSL